MFDNPLTPALFPIRVSQNVCRSVGVENCTYNIRVATNKLAAGVVVGNDRVLGLLGTMATATATATTGNNTLRTIVILR